MKSKRKNQEDYVRCCLNCEWAQVDEHEEFTDSVYCRYHKKGKESDDRCRHYCYDLLKRKPHRHTEIPTLDPEALSL
ncbi:MAG: hypothetical protein IKD35_04520 [Clostridia bacterium]|nr:hypothetical protein [Clostridia bacterium]